MILKLKNILNFNIGLMVLILLKMRKKSLNKEKLLDIIA